MAVLSFHYFQVLPVPFRALWQHVVFSDPRDRLTTILVAPLMTCSARLPVYALLISAFIPEQTVWGVLNLQGLGAVWPVYGWDCECFGGCICN